MGKIKALFGCDRGNSGRYYRLPLIIWWVGLAGCTSLKKAALIGTGSLGAGAIASIDEPIERRRHAYSS
jgi:hypothetical protein